MGLTHSLKLKKKSNKRKNQKCWAVGMKNSGENSFLREKENMGKGFLISCKMESQTLFVLAQIWRGNFLQGVLQS